jgi:Spy/CpxP family protein refolding chaperone
MKKLFLTIALLLWAMASVAQQPPANAGHDHAAMMAQHAGNSDHQQSGANPQAPTNPYAGTPAGLSDAQRAQYLSGEGMGFAKPAEMNHYPGPRHVLQNAERIKLSSAQLAATQKLFDGVQQKAKELGKQIVDREDELIRIFSSQTADEARVKQLTAEIGNLQGELRAAHLTAHLKERSLLSAEQVRIYDEARDYVPGEKPAPALHQH